MISRVFIRADVLKNRFSSTVFLLFRRIVIFVWQTTKRTLSLPEILPVTSLLLEFGIKIKKRRVDLS